MKKDQRLFGLPLPACIAIGMVLGVFVGPLLGPHARVLGALGSVTIQLIKAIATPLLFFAIVRALATTEVRGAWLGRLVVVALINVSVALGIGLFFSNLVEPGSRLGLKPAASAGDFSGKRFDPVKAIQEFIPSDIVSPFLNNAVLSVVILALLCGFALRAAARAGEDEDATRGVSTLVTLMHGGYRVAEVVLGWVLLLIPLAVFGVVAKTVGELGLRPLLALSLYVGLALAGFAIHIAVTYQLWIALFAKLSLARFWRAARAPLSLAWGSNSSLATLPLTLDALGELGVSREASALGACVGTNLNNDGIVLYEGMAALWVAQAAGIHLSLPQQLVVAAVCIVAAMGVAGVPEAGFVSLAIVLNAVGLPLEFLPLLLTVDWVVARGRSMVNVLSDMVLSIILDRWDELARGVSGPPNEVSQ